MRIIIDRGLTTEQEICNVTLFLTLGEAKELKDSISQMIERNHHHSHISDTTYQKEITIAWDGDIPNKT